MPEWPITATPGVQGGEPCIRDTRFPTHTAWSYFRNGCTLDTLAAEYRHLTREQLVAAIAFEQGRRFGKQKRKGTFPAADISRFLPGGEDWP